jgi:hypothetical protein
VQFEESAKGVIFKSSITGGFNAGLVNLSMDGPILYYELLYGDNTINTLGPVSRRTFEIEPAQELNMISAPAPFHLNPWRLP